MSIVKGLLLGSAASLAVASGTQAADLPVKAKPVEYVKVCSLYGAGFFYIPGTDTCIKLGGAVRVQAEFNAGSGGVPVGLGSSTEAAQGAFTRATTNDVNFRTRLFFSFDARQQTEYGTLRTFARFGAQQTTPGDASANNTTVFWDRAFIQFAGFTIGKTLSFYDGFSSGNFQYNNPRGMSDSSATPVGLTLWAYTAQLGNGISATLSAEDPNARTKLVEAVGISAWSFGSTGTNANGLSSNGGNNGMLFPDVIGALRSDQTWGSAQVMAAMHDASGQYYTSGVVSSGHPANAYGWAVGGAFLINLPNFGSRSDVNSQPNVDQFGLQATVGKGALGYTTDGVGPWALAKGNTSISAAWGVDGIYGTGTNVELTNSWSVYAAYQHLWTPNWRTSIYADYLAVNYDGPATSLICGPAGTGAMGFTLTSGGCNPNFKVWQVGTRTQWNPVSQLDVGVDVLYSRLDTAFAGATTTTAIFPAAAGRPVGLPISFADQDVWSVMFRVQRNFWP
jgi:hypothetical protein